MSNENRPHGFGVLRRRGGGPLETAVFNKLVGFGTGIFKGDVVMQVAGDATFGPVIQPGLTTPGTTQPSGIALNWAAASLASQHWVYTDPDVIFEGQDNNTANGFTADNEGLNASLSAGAGSATTHLSGHVVDEVTIATTASSDFHALGLFHHPMNAYGPNARIELCFNHHRLGMGVAAV